MKMLAVVCKSITAFQSCRIDRIMISPSAKTNSNTHHASLTLRLNSLNRTKGGCLSTVLPLLVEHIPYCSFLNVKPAPCSRDTNTCVIVNIAVTGHVAKKLSSLLTLHRLCCQSGWSLYKLLLAHFPYRQSFGVTVIQHRIRPCAMR